MPNRRMVLKGLVAASVCLSGVGAGCGGVDLGPVAAGNLSDLQVGALKAIVGEGVAIGRDAEGLYALSTVCTHQGCDMGETGTVGADGLVCSCHGSEFGVTGQVEVGPAEDDLTHYLVEVDGAGEILIDTRVVVNAERRTDVSGGTGAT